MNGNGCYSLPTDTKTVQMNIATAQIDFKMSFADLIRPKTFEQMLIIC